jgi:Secretion system C-terminal sorting domain
MPLFKYISMKKYFFVFIIFYSSVNAQKYDYNWQLGYQYTPGLGFELNFNNKQSKLNIIKRDHNYYLNGLTISNPKSGSLLFTTNGCNIYNKNFEIMENGEDLNPSEPTTISCSGLGNNFFQGSLALPLPESNDSIFYLFHQALEWLNTPNRLLAPNKFYQSIININANNGLGRVIKKNFVLSSDTLDGGISSVKHANGIDWWVIVREYRTSNFYIHKFTKNGLDSPSTQSIGIPYQYLCNGGTQQCFSPDGSKFASYSNCDGLSLYDFDRKTGKLSNFRNFRINEDPAFIYGGVAFSPNSRFVYAFTGLKIIQFDLQATSLEDGKLKVADFDSFLYPFHVYLSFAQLAPDCRIYIFSINGIQAFGYMRYPDRKGTACEVVQHGILLPTDKLAIAGTAPNFPNYRLGVTPTYPCDSTIDFKVSTQDLLPSLNVIAYPNPVTEKLFFDFDKVQTQSKDVKISVIDLMGKVVAAKKMNLYDRPPEGRLSIDVENLSEGMYILNVEVLGYKNFTHKFVKTQ